MARAIWTGSISFGLVTVPVRVFSAVHEHDVRFHQVAPDGSRIRYQRVSEKTGKVVEYDDIKKGVETSKGKRVVIDRSPTSTPSRHDGRVSARASGRWPNRSSRR